MAPRSYGQHSAVAHALELVGERWSLLIVRDLLVGPRRYGELKRSLARIPTNILATRLAELQAAGLVRRIPRVRQIVYELTPYGRELEEIVLSLGRWGARTLGDPGESWLASAESIAIDLRAAFRPEVAETLPPTRYQAWMGESSVRLQVSGSRLDLLDGAAEEPPLPDLAFEIGRGLHRLLQGAVSARDALDRDEVRILAGEPALLERFVRTFRLAA